MRSSKRRLAGFRAARDQLAGGRFGIGGKYQPIDEAGAPRLVGAQRLAREHHLHGSAYTADTHRAHGAAETRMDAQHHLGKSDREIVALDADAITAGQRKLEAAAEREAVDDGDRGAGQGFERGEDGMRTAHHLLGLRGILEAGELLHVGAGDEAAGFSRADHQAARRRGGERLQVRVELEQRHRSTGRWWNCRACRTSASRCQRHRQCVPSSWT